MGEHNHQSSDSQTLGEGASAEKHPETGQANSHVDAAPVDISPRSIHGWKWAVAYMAMLSTTFLFALDNTIVADIQPAIVHDYGNVELLPWIGTGFALGTMAILSWGKVYGIFNIKWVYTFNILIFEVGSALCGAAPNMSALIIGRVIAGVGGSGMYSGTLTYVSVSTTMNERPAYMAGSTAVWGVGTVLGHVVGGAFSISSATWRWGFYINFVIGAAFAPAYLLLFPSIDPQPGKTSKEKREMMDWPMTAVFLAGSACFVMVITFGGSLYSWNSGALIALWTVSDIFLIVTFLLAKFHPGVSKDHRLYPAHFLKRPILMNLQLQVFLSSAIILAMTYYIPLFFQFVRGDGPLDGGIRLLPLIVFMVVVSMVNGVLMYTIHADTPNTNIYGYTILIGAGAGCYIVAGFSIVQSLVLVTDIANAVGAMTIAQDLGMVLFLAISGSIFQNTAVQKIGSALPNASPAEIMQLMTGTSSAVYMDLFESDKRVVIPQITDAMSNVWFMFLVAAALSFVCSLPLGPKQKQRKVM
ncbi:major facilitator superfamily domain-containing protein [Phialemonium atrogriseum]|uniref:Major facilitator superfamily domain-containing protein n=1 Tax=Phialemonium atrogriseum TaxID=1093897 RepID=A0AAJ0BX36_9PEZI|nr:major facilitator superfamily domain-containing protein [Phialemonium atrogriseum]KAK1765886.1 major facilitator superfamily domain-containing protein [Phialemonium atrogriseum]